ncbi:MAG: hypothetical protein LM580_05220 [Thermofilum sp.]|nr:hypothetical protein [Thermofilum sp.]
MRILGFLRRGAKAALEEVELPELELEEGQARALPERKPEGPRLADWAREHGHAEALELLAEPQLWCGFAGRGAPTETTLEQTIIEGRLGEPPKDSYDFFRKALVALGFGPSTAEGLALYYTWLLEARRIWSEGVRRAAEGVEGRAEGVAPRRLQPVREPTLADLLSFLSKMRPSYVWGDIAWAARCLPMPPLGQVVFREPNCYMLSDDCERALRRPYAKWWFSDRWHFTLYPQAFQPEMNLPAAVWAVVKGIGTSCARSRRERELMAQLALYMGEYRVGPVNARLLIDPKPELVRRVFEEYAEELEKAGEADVAREVRWFAAGNPRRALLRALEVTYRWDEQGIPLEKGAHWDRLLNRLIKAAAGELGQQQAPTSEP